MISAEQLRTPSEGLWNTDARRSVTDALGSEALLGLDRAHSLPAIGPGQSAFNAVMRRWRPACSIVETAHRERYVVSPVITQEKRVPHSRQKPRSAIGEDRLIAGPCEVQRRLSRATHARTAKGPPVARLHISQWQ